jgi:NTE family protein
MGRPKVALVLGGGAARGLAHLGVLQVLEHARIPIDLIVGTSMGALIGAMYAAKPQIDKIMTDVTAYLESDRFAESKVHSLRRGTDEDHSLLDQVTTYLKRAQMISSTVMRKAYLDDHDVREYLSNFVDDRDIKTLKIPFCAIATDVVTGQQAVIETGPVIDAVAASSAIPGAFPPVRIGHRTCIDGGIVNMVPVTVAIQKGADFVIAVNVSHELPEPRELKRALEIYFRAHEITKKNLIAHQLKFADVVMSPQVGNIHWADFSQPKQMIEAGHEVAEKALGGIYFKLQKMRRLPRMFWKRSVKLDDMIP